MAGDVTGTYYPSEGIHGYGAELLLGDGGTPESFEAVAYVSSITFGAMTTAVIDRTHLRSPAAHREKMPGLRDSGPFTVKGIWVPDHQSQSNAGGGSGAFQDGGLIAKWISRAIMNAQIRVNDGSPATTFPFRGFVSQFQPGEIGPDDKIDFTAEITPVSDFSSQLP